MRVGQRSCHSMYPTPLAERLHIRPPVRAAGPRRMQGTRPLTTARRRRVVLLILPVCGAQGINWRRITAWTAHDRHPISVGFAPARLMAIQELGRSLQASRLQPILGSPPARASMPGARAAHYPSCTSSSPATGASSAGCAANRAFRGMG
jgi:hypothetical protein